MCKAVASIIRLVKNIQRGISSDIKVTYSLVVVKNEYERENLSYDDMVLTLVQFTINLTLLTMWLVIPLLEDLIES